MKSALKKLAIFFALSIFFVGGFSPFSNVASAQGLNLGLAPIAATGLATTDIRVIIANIIRIALGLLGIGAVGLMMYAGYEWMTAGGNEEQIGTAKKILVNATIGLTIILSAYSIVSFVVKSLVDATTGVDPKCAAQIADSGGTYLCDGDCPPCPCTENCIDPYHFYVDAKAPAGNVCIMNVSPMLKFSEPVDLSTVNGEVVVYENDSGSKNIFNGHWEFAGSNQSIVHFIPNDDEGPIVCPDGLKDCFASSTDYVVNFKSADSYKDNVIKNINGSKVLSCQAGVTCGDTTFHTGTSTDRTAPTFSIDTISELTGDNKLEKDVSHTVNFSAYDDAGVQYADLTVDGKSIGHLTYQNCSKSRSSQIIWDTKNFVFGQKTLQVTGYDFAGHLGTSSQMIVDLIPHHCFNNVLDADETKIDCGGSCGQCTGDICKADSDCISGYCQITPPATDGICVERMYIKNISPIPAAHGDYLSIYGRYFGDNPGHVYFRNSSNQDTEASVVNCGPGFDNWVPNQIIVEVPIDAIGGVSGTIRVVTASTTNASGTISSWEDVTGPGGWKAPQSPNFVLTSVTHPGICGISPTSSQPGNFATVHGKNFGASGNATNYFKFFENILPPAAWSDTSSTVKVPVSLSNGDFIVKIQRDGIDSNGIYFNIFGTLSNGPVITSLSATSGVFGDYLTIYGKNFGNVQNQVLFNKILGGDTLDSSTLIGGNNFPNVCKGSTWNDKQIVVKMPDMNSGDTYAVRVIRSDPDYASSTYDKNKVIYSVPNGFVKPGICNISPKSAMVPGPVTIDGENFEQGDKVYFSQANSVQEDLATFASGTIYSSNYSATENNGKSASVSSTTSTASGPVFVVNNGQRSNSMNFKVFDCRSKENINTCGFDQKCCEGGASAGSCIASEGLCGDERKSSGYMWMFSANKLTEQPHVIERCGPETETSISPALPSPSPSTQWGGSSTQVCHTALPTVEFSTMMSSTLLNASTVQVYSCGSGATMGSCSTAVSVNISVHDVNNFRNFIQISPQTPAPHRWAPNTWYQVRLMNGIKTLNDVPPQPLLVNANSCASGAAYCFNFKTSLDAAGQDDCVLKSVLVTPTSFWTSIIDAVNPVQVRNVFSPYDLVYQGNGHSDQKCTMMNVADLNWNWSSASTSLAQTVYSGVAPLSNNQSNVLALRNTVGYGLSGDSVRIRASVSSSQSISGVPGTCFDDGTTACSNTSDCVYTIYKYLQFSIKKKPADPIGICTAHYTDIASGNPVAGLFSDSTSQIKGCGSSSDCTANSEFNTWYNAISATYAKNKTVICDPVTSWTQNTENHNSTCNNVFPSIFGESPLKIDLSNPEVEDYAPNCLEACTNATVWARFNTSMSPTKNVSNHSQAVKIFKCTDENCSILNTSNEIYSNNVSFDGDNRTLNIFGKDVNDVLELNSLYLVQLSNPVSPENVNNNTQLWSADTSGLVKPYNKTFSWRFRTKKTACVPNTVDVTPKVFTAHKLNDRTVFQSDVFSAPDACSAKGQKLNPWKLDWHWSTSNYQVAGIYTVSTTGHNPYCTSQCLKNGSTVPYVSSTSPIYPVCGNGKVEAGEDCDGPLATSTSAGCQLNCLYFPNHPRKAGSKTSTDSKSINASICGNGMLGLDEDCDLGVNASVSSPTSSFLCSSNCLHLGSRLSAAWCQHPASTTASGFSAADINAACASAFSQCRDGAVSLDEDAACEAGSSFDSTKCNDRCLINDGSVCTPGAEGCGDNGQLLGSSLMYSSPSVCGDGKPGTGEDASCETLLPIMKFGHTFIDPWVLAIGQGSGVVSAGNPPVQESTISANISSSTVFNITGTGKYQVPCGFDSDAQCNSFASNTGLGNDSCCYARPNLTGVYPGSTSTVSNNICLNTYIEADFDSKIDLNTIPGNLYLARGVDASGQCPQGSIDVTTSTVTYSGIKNLAWYEKIWQSIVAFVKRIFFDKATATTYRWCAGLDVGTPNVIFNSDGISSKVTLTLDKALTVTTSYRVILTSAVKNVQGVSIAKNSSGLNPSWQFNTGDHICAVAGVKVNPSQAYFTRPNTSTLFAASAQTNELLNGQPQIIVPVVGYTWDYIWGPAINPYVTFSTTSASSTLVTSQNRNGELDVFASANVTSDFYNKVQQIGVVATGKSHVIVFLCENPWPPKEVFPYADSEGNHDGFDVSSSIFDGSAIPPSNVYKGGYFNFKTYYCADNGNVGNYDDLPYLRPVVQASYNILGVNSANPMVCENNQMSCSSDPNCSINTYKVETHQFSLLPNQSGVCVINYSASSGGGNKYYFTSSSPSGQPIKCSADSDCSDILNTTEYKNSAIADGVSCLDFSKVKPISAETHKCVANNIAALNALKRFLFTNDKNGDAIGIQVFDNPDHLILRTWLKNRFNINNFQDVASLPDGYEAMTDGQNIYVNALNFSQESLISSSTGNLSNNIYLFSISNNARPETVKVFEELIKNTTFNANLNNYGYCGTSVTLVDGANQVACKNDFDCKVQGVCQQTSQTQSVCQHNTSIQCGGGPGCPKYMAPGVCNLPTPGSVKVCSNEAKVCNGPSDCTKKTMFGYVFTPSTTATGACAVQKSGYTGMFVDSVTKELSLCNTATDCKGTEFDNFFSSHPGTYKLCYPSALIAIAATCNVSSTVKVCDGTSDICTDSTSCAGVLTNDNCVSQTGNVLRCSNKSSQSCVDNKDCVVQEVCANQTDKLKRDYQRLQKLSTIDQTLNMYFANNNYVYPELKSGTFLTGQSISTWPSWSSLGSLPIDPVNILGPAGTCAVSTTIYCGNDAACDPVITSTSQKCVLHAPDTGWSTVDRRFSFACAPSSLAFRYIVATSSLNYQLKSHFESVGLNILNLQDFFDYFIPKDQARYNLSPSWLNTDAGLGICNQPLEIATLSQGKCGDGQVNLNLGEQCDPPGKKVFHTEQCSATVNQMDIDICDANCHYPTINIPTTTCSILSTCGNGIIEQGEICDDGAQNGHYNHCAYGCHAFAASCGDGVVSSTVEVCDIAAPDKTYDTALLYASSTGWCVGGVKDNSRCIDNPSCNFLPAGAFSITSTNGYCVTLDTNKNRYNLAKSKSCNFDCQKTGPYCGDGIVQAEFGEECDPAKNYSCDSNLGDRNCKSDCRWKNDAAVAYYNFNDVLLQNGTSDISNIASSSAAAFAYCATGYCPTPTSSGHFNQAMNFDGASQYFKIDYKPIFDVNEITISAWIKIPSNTSSPSVAPIISKNSSPDLTYDDYTFAVFNQTQYVGGNFGKNIVNNLGLISGNSVPAPYAAIFGNYTALDMTNTSSILSTDQWHFVAVTVDANRVVKFYVDSKEYNGQNILTSGLNTTGVTSTKAEGKFDLNIGKGLLTFGDVYFKGALDDVQLYNRPLSSSEMSDLYLHTDSFCQLKNITVTTLNPEQPTCGNDKIEPGEDCDNGSVATGGTNGVPCIPSYGKSCWFCTDKSCLKQNVSPTAYCGDGVVNGNEKCDKTYYNNVATVWSINSSTGSGFFNFGFSTGIVNTGASKGYEVLPCYEEYNTKLQTTSKAHYNDSNLDGGWAANLITKVGLPNDCINNCSEVQKKCVECGQDPQGTQISGAAINVLETQAGATFSAIDLMYPAKTEIVSVPNQVTPTLPKNDWVAYFAGSSGSLYKHSYSLLAVNSIKTLSTDANPVATINTDPVCSDDSFGRSYKLRINNDDQPEHLIDFKVVASTTASLDQYDLMLSPVINNNAVISSGATNYHRHDIRIVLSWVGDDQFTPGLFSATALSKPFEISPDIARADYSSATPSTSAIWYHGEGSGKKSHEIAFTVDTSAMSEVYGFYVHAVDHTMINYENKDKIRVDVYTSEDDMNQQHYARPTKTYYLDGSVYYANANSSGAYYWHVFNINPSNFGDPASSMTNIVDNAIFYNRTVSKLEMIYDPKTP